MNIDPNKTYKRLVRAGEDWADKEAAFILFDENKKSVLAKEQNIAIEKTNCSVARAETIARASKNYEDYIKQLSEAKKNAIKARVKYDSIKIYISLQHSKYVTRREEMKEGKKLT